MLLEFVSLTKANNGKNLQKEKFKIPTTHLTIPVMRQKSFNYQLISTNFYSFLQSK